MEEMLSNPLVKLIIILLIIGGIASGVQSIVKRLSKK